MAFSPKAGAVISFTVEGAQSAQRQIETIGDAFDRMSSVARTGLAALAAGFTAWKIGEYVKDATLLAARYETLGIVMHTAGVNAGYSNAQMDAYAKGLEKSGISMVKAREAMTSMTTANLDNNKALELGRMAQNLAVVANKSSSETLTDLITNIQQADTEGLKHMGIILSQDEALQKYATAHGTVTKALTQTQKAEAIQQAVMLQGAKYAGIYEQAMGTAGKALSSLDRYFENIKVRLGTPFLEGFAQGVFGATDGVKELNRQLDDLEKSGAMEDLAKSIGSSVGAVISVIKGTVSVIGDIGGAVVRVGKVAADFFNDYLGGMTTVKAATVGFALLLSGFMVEQAIIGFNGVSAAAWAGATRVGAAFLAMGTAATNTFRLMQLSAATLGWGPAIMIAGRTATAAIGATVTAIPGAIGAIAVAAGVGLGYLLVQAFGDTISKGIASILPKFVDDAMNRAVAYVKGKVSDIPDISEAVRNGKVISDADAAENRLRIKREDQVRRDMNNAVVASEGMIAVTTAANTRLKALNDLRDQQLKQSLDQRITTQTEYLQQKEKLDVAEAQGQLNQIAAQKAQLAAYMAAFKAGAPLGQGRDPAADSNEMTKLLAEEAAAQTKLGAVKQNYAYQIAGAMVEGYTKEFGSIESLVEAQRQLWQSTNENYALAGKTAEQREILAAKRLQSGAEELALELAQKQANGTATTEYVKNASALISAMEGMGAARIKALSKNVSTDFINDTKALRDDTVAVYNEMKLTFLGTEEERIRVAAQASIRLAGIRLADAKLSIAGTNDSDAQKEAAVKKLTDAYNGYTAAVNENADARAKQASVGYQELAATLSEAFDPRRIENFGDTLANAFGTAGYALGDLLDNFAKFDKQQELSDAARSAAFDKFKDKPKELAAANAAINAKQTKDSLAYYANMAGAAKGFFKEQTTGYKLLEGAEKAFRLAELAYQMESLYTHLFVTTAKVAGTTAGQAGETAAVGAGETARNLLKVPGVFMSFMSALGPWGMAAAGVAIAAVLGGAFSGGSSVNIAEQRQKEQGAGTVLGDKSAKSDSIKRSLDLAAANSSTQIDYLKDMLMSLRTIEANIGKFASQVVQNSDIQNPNVGNLNSNNGAATKGVQVATFAAIGSIVGPIGALVGALIGVLAKNIPIIGKVATAIFGGKQTIEDSGFTLGKANLASVIANGANGMTYADVKTSGGWFGKDKTSTQSTSLGAVANQQFTLIIKSMADGITQAASLLGAAGSDFDMKLSSFVIDIGKVSLKGLTGEEQQKALESVFSKLGDQMAKWALSGLDQFAKVGEGYLETLTRVATDYAKVDASMTSMGRSFGAVGIQSLAAREALIDLMGGIDNLQSSASNFVSNFLTKEEQLAPVAKYVGEQLAKMNLAWVDTRDEFKQVALAADLTTEAGRQQYAMLMQLADAFAATHEAVRDLTKSAQEIADERKDLLDQLDELTMSSTQLLAKQRDALDESNRALFDQVQAIKAVKDTAASMLAGVGDAFSALQKVVTREKSVLQTSVDSHTAAFNKLQSLSQSLHSTLNSLKSPDQKAFERAAAQAQIRAALAIAKAGGPLPDSEKLKDALSAVTQDASKQFGSYADYMRDLLQTQNDVAQLAGLTDDSLSVEQKSLDALNAQLKSLDAIVANGQAQIDALNGQSVATLSLAQAMAALQDSIGAAKTNPVVGGTSAIAGFYQDLFGRSADQAGLQYWQDALAKGSSLENIRAALMQSDEYKRLHPFAVGTNFVPETMPALVHQGERIIPAADNRVLMSVLQRASGGDGGDTAVAEELKALREEVKGLRAEARAIAGHTEKTSRITRALRGDELKINSEVDA